MILVNVLVEHNVFSLNRPFTYFYDGSRQLLKGLRVNVNFHNQSLVGYITNVYTVDKTKEEIEKESGFELKELGSIIDEEPILNDELFSLSEYMETHYVSTLIRCLQTILPPSLKPSSSYISGAKIAYIKQIVYIKDDDSLTKKQKETLELIKTSNYSKVNEYSPSIVKKLLAKSCIEIKEVENYRYKYLDEKSKYEFILNKEQQDVYDSFINSNDEVYLLKGVTGSGKTEVYLKLVENCIENGKDALILVPEINLTPLLKKRVLNYFKEKIAILHSGLTGAERYDEYRRILKGDAHIVIGTRSAVFAPLTNIGLIVIDEEFSSSYKNMNTPFYNAIDLAKVRAKFYKAKVLLTSATPSLESMARAEKGVYHLLTLKERFNAVSLPETHLVNMNDTTNVVPGYSLISKDLYRCLAITLNLGKQSILLVNRRGFSYKVICKDCNSAQLCPDCGMPLYYHKNGNVIKCHHCGYSISASKYKCSECGGANFAFLGFGTEKIVEQLHALFPKARIKHFDSDYASNEKKISLILDDFDSGNIDILVGTQMVAKGHDFPNVILSAIISADDMLQSYSFRTAENAFDLITQCVGRSGRDNEKGYAIIQANAVNNYAINLGCMQNYDLFYKMEMEKRKKTANPPYFYLTRLYLSSKNSDKLQTFSSNIKSLLKSLNNQYIIVYVNTMAKKGLKFNQILTIKYKDEKVILDFLNKYLKDNFIDNLIDIEIDVDCHD